MTTKRKIRPIWIWKFLGDSSGSRFPTKENENSWKSLHFWTFESKSSIYRQLNQFRKREQVFTATSIRWNENSSSRGHAEGLDHFGGEVEQNSCLTSAFARDDEKTFK